MDNNRTRQDIKLETKLNDEGLLEVTTPSVYNFKEIAGTANYLYFYVTVEVGGRSQQININMHDVTERTEEEYQHINTDQWSEVVSALAEHSKVYVHYYGEAVELNTLLELKQHQSLSINNSDFTIGSGGVLRIIGDQFGGGHIHVSENIIVSDGGKITTNSQSTTQRLYHSSGVYSSGKITVASGGEITIPQTGLLSLNGNHGVVIEQDGALNVTGMLDQHSDIEIHGTMSIVGSDGNYTNAFIGRATIYGDVTINGLLEVSKNGMLSVSGMNTINEDGELRVSKGSTSLNGKTYNFGKITVTEGILTLSNVEFAVNNDGVISIAKNAVVELPGTTLVNNGEIAGTGSIVLTESVNAAANYVNGIEYVYVEGDETISNYSRYQFVTDPEETVTGIIYESKISGTGNVDSNIKVKENNIPDSE